MKVREFADGIEIAQALLIREAEVRGGGQRLKLMLGDRTGTVPASLSYGVSEAHKICRPGAVVWVTGSFAVHPRFGARLELQAVSYTHLRAHET